MDDKTVIVAKKKPVSEAVKPDGKKSNNKGKTAKEVLPDKPLAKEKPKARASNWPVYIFALFAFLLIGAGSAITMIYVLTSVPSSIPDITDKDLSADLVAVQTDASAAEDEALIRAAIEPHVIELSGDPIVVRQLGNAMRQLAKLDKDPQKKAAADLGIGGDVFRFKDVLDVPNPGLQAGVMGSQEDIASMQSGPSKDATTENSDAPQTENDDGSSVLAASEGAPVKEIVEFAEVVKSPGKISNLLKDVGLAPAQVVSVEDAFSNFYSIRSLKKGDRFAVRAIADTEQENQLLPVQFSVYDADKLIGSVALNDIDAFAKSEDPWYNRDIFETSLLPPVTDPENQPRLLDALYSAALRNRLPTAVTGEAIMLASRSQDLEQKVQPGDTITLVYSPTARDINSGLGRIIYLSIGRTTGNLECYVTQQSAGAKFECASLDGQTGVNEAGMVTPVNGVIVAKFGPQGEKDPNPGQMNFGVDWTAPIGSPVIAAFAGDVTAAGPEAGFGNVVRLSHPDGKSTMYGFLQHINIGVGVGAKITAGQLIGFVGTGPTSREPRLHFELTRNGVPVDPVAEMQAGGGGGVVGAVDQFVHRIIYIESGNRCDASNPLSTAVGLGQFIESTWMTTIRLHRPDLLQGRSRQQILDMRTNCDLARTMTAAFTKDNAAVLRQAGHTVTPGNLYLAHFLGVGGASKVLGSSADRQISDVFGSAHVRANPFERGKSIGYLISWAAKKMGGKTPQTPPATTSPAAPSATASNAPVAAPAAVASNSAPMIKYADDPALAKLKAAVVAFLQ